MGHWVRRNKGLQNSLHLHRPSQQSNILINRYQVRELIKKLDEKKGMVNFR